MLGIYQLLENQVVLLVSILNKRYDIKFYMNPIILKLIISSQHIYIMPLTIYDLIFLLRLFGLALY